MRVVRPSRNFLYTLDPTAAKPSDYFVHDEDTYFHGSNAQVALTCLPESVNALDLEFEGCRTDPVKQLRTCICYTKDYCNLGSRTQVHFVFIGSILLLLMHHVI